MIKMYFSGFCPVSALCCCSPLWAACRSVNPTSRCSTKLYFSLLAWLPLRRLAFFPQNSESSHDTLYVFVEITHWKDASFEKKSQMIPGKCIMVIREAPNCPFSQPCLKCVTCAPLFFRNVSRHVLPNWCLSSGGISLLLYWMSMYYFAYTEMY